MKLYRGFATVGAMTILSRVLGFVRDVLIAAVLGTSFVADAFFVAFRVPNMFRRLFAEGAFDAAFIPLFAKRLHEEGPARAFAGQALAGLTVLLVAFTILGEIAMPWLMLLLAPGFRDDPEKFALVVMLARIALPYLVCMSLVALYTGVLNALGRFAIAAFTPSLLNVVLIVVLLGLVATGNTEKGQAGVMLARHHSVETLRGREGGLGAHLGDDLRCAQVEMRVATQRDRTAPKGPTGVHGRAS